MKSWLTLFATVLPVLVIFNSLSVMATTTTPTSPFVGKWHLTELINPKTGTQPLPDKIMAVDIESISETELSLSINVGNNMGSTITLADATATSSEVRVGPVMSTEMMPPQDLWEVEQFLAKTLETVHKMKVNKDNNLVLEGDGSIICSK
eukprot:scaffold2962_cov126-Cylindrotheca_fusiformis.AAC.5